MTNKESAAAVGLDIGTSRIVTATRAGQEHRYSSQLNAFVTIPFSRLTQSAFLKERIPHKVEGEQMIVYGNESEKLANIFRRETRRPMTRGVLNPDEPESLDRIRDIVNVLLAEENRSGQRLCFAVPAPPIGSPDDLTYHEVTLKQALFGMGFQVSSINEGLAVVLAELESENYTGIGISCGGGMCNVCLAYLSVPIFNFSTAKGGDFVDQSTANVTSDGPTRIRLIKERSFHFNGHFTDKTLQALSVYYDDMIRTVVQGLRDSFSRSKNIPQFDRPIPIVISGGSALPAGFRDRFEKVLNENPLPISLSGVRLAADPLNTTAKGALVAALAEL